MSKKPLKLKHKSLKLMIIANKFIASMRNILISLLIFKKQVS